MGDSIIQRILDRTNGGLDIILALVPEADKCIDNNRKFKLRQAEKTPSATLKKGSNGNYFVKDFGGDFSGNAVNLYVYLENVELKTAIKVLGARYQCLDDNQKPEELMPKIEKRPATETEQPGEYYFKYRENNELTDLELETLFAKSVIQHSSNMDNKDWTKHLRNVCAAYGVFALTSFTYIKDREAIVTSSTDKYPIFVIEGETFKKIYQPKSLDKQYRFRYAGTKTPDYIFGLKRFEKKFNDEQAKWEAEQNEEDDAGKPFLLEEVIICSGDRDSLNVAALGYNVIWLNSESAKLSPKIYNSLKAKTKGVYNLPDLDATGVKQGHAMALFYLDMKTIQLPLELLEKKDWRGNACKDVRDYLSYWTKKDFDKLVKAAVEYQFWDEEAQFDKNGKFKKNNYVFNHVRAYNFMMKCGFYRIESKTSKTGYDYIFIKNNVVKVVDDVKIKEFINQFLEERFTDDQRLRNTFYRSNQLKDESLVNLKMIQMDFTYYDREHQYFFFLDKTWKVTAGKIEEFRASETNKMVWESKVVQHHAKLKEPPFTIKTIELADGSTQLDIEIHRNDCLFLNYLINTSRVHWRKELEENCEATYPTEAEREEYRNANKFNIAGPLLTTEEQTEQKLHLINKIYVLGYMLSRYKEKSKPWSPFLMDHKLSDEGQSHGGSGKTIFARSVEPFMNFLLIDGKSKSLTDDKHAFENVTEKTEIILIDDLSRYLNIESFFSMITEGMTVNPKYNQRFTIEYQTSPKIIFTSNFGVKDITPSAERRLIYASFSDYYHNNSTGDYREERTPAHDFGKDLLRDFTAEEWIEYANTMAYSLQAYMRIPTKVQPPMDNIAKRNLQGIMGDSFLGWADVYFSFENKRLDEMVPRNEAFQAFVKETNAPKWYTTNKFTAAVEAWCKFYRYGFNPQELRNDKGRIVKKWPVKGPDGIFLTEPKVYKDGSVKVVNVKKTTEMIYIKTIEGAVDLNKWKDTEHDEEPAATNTIPAAPGIIMNDLDDDPLA